MKVTIIPEDKAVYKDGYCITPLEFVAPQNVHAFQWYGTKGEIEFLTNDAGEKQANEKIDSLPQWVLDAIAVFDSAQAEIDAIAQQETVTVSQG